MNSEFESSHHEENEICSDGQIISVGAWGCTDGKDWCFKAKHGIKQIIIRSGGVIDSIMFNEASTEDWSARFGGSGGDRTEKICIDFPSEYLTGITGTYGRWEGYRRLVRSLYFHTNQTRYGPFGCVAGDKFSFNAEGGVITGFHGRSGTYLDAIGVFLKHSSSVVKTVAMRERQSDFFVECPRLLCRSPGPWGSSNGGREWDDGVFSSVKEVFVYVSLDVCVISGIRFTYEMKFGVDFSSPKHGNCGQGSVESARIIKLEKFKIRGDDEFLIGLDGFYKQVDGVDVITSLTFHTNKGKYGRIGYENGIYFNSMSSMASHGKVVGFFGRCGAYLNAIGIHTEYSQHIFK